MLQTAPSLDVYAAGEERVGEEEKEDDHEEKEELDLRRSVTIGDKIDALGSGDFTFGESESNHGGEMGLIEEGSEVDEEEEEEEEGEKEEFHIGGGDTIALTLRKEAELLLSNGDLQGAEDYFYRATMADPDNGEIMLQFAKLVWQVYHDSDRSMKYFERAALAAPENSDVLGAYASFLWEIGEDDEDDSSQEACVSSSAGLVSGFDRGTKGASTSTEEYYSRMVEENSSDPLFLKSNSQFLYKSKGDLHQAEEFYSRAIQADPSDGEIMSQYARLIWELHHDHVKALFYFERAVQVSIGDSAVAAAYASFLWEIGEDEDDDVARP